jgi:stage V sporulation protein B
VLKDAALGPLLRISAAVVLSYALYAALMGYLNGRQLFSRQAALDTTFSTLRTGGILLGAGLGFGVFGAITGFAAAAVGVLLLAVGVVGLGKRGERLPLSRWTSFMWPIWIYQSFLNGILLIDLLVLKSTLATIAERGGATAAEAAAVANEHAGLYSAAQKFAFIPYQLMLSLTFIVFPMISRATSAGDSEATRRTIRGAIRFVLIVLVGIAAPIAGASAGILRVAYPDEYVVGADALAVLVLGAAAFALFVISATALSGAGRPGIAAWIAALGLAAVVGLDRGLLELVGIGEHTLLATASGTACGMTLAMIISAVAVRAKLGAYVAPLSASRILIAGGAAWGVARVVPHGTAIGAVTALAAGSAAFGVALLVTRELGTEDLKRVLVVVGRKKG